MELVITQPIKRSEITNNSWERLPLGGFTPATAVHWRQHLESHRAEYLNHCRHQRDRR